MTSARILPVRSATVHAMAVTAAAALVALLAAAGTAAARQQASLIVPGERHFTAMRQLTHGGQNAEAYYAADGARLIFQSQRDSFACDQIFSMDTAGAGVKLLSTGKGRTTCSFFFPDGRTILYASTHLADAACPPVPDRSKGYVWSLYPSYDIFTADTQGTILRR